MRFLKILGVVFIVLFICNATTLAPQVTTCSVNLGIEGKYFYKLRTSSNLVYQITLMRYIWSVVIFFAGLASLVAILVGVGIMAAMGRARELERSGPLPIWAKLLIVATFVGLVTFAGILVYKGHHSVYPPAPTSPSQLLLDLQMVNTYFFEQHGKFARDPRDLAGTGRLHHSGADLLSGMGTLSGYTFVYSSDGTWYECIARPSSGNPEMPIYFTSSKNPDVYRLFQDGTLDRLREVISTIYKSRQTH